LGVSSAMRLRMAARSAGVARVLIGALLRGYQTVTFEKLLAPFGALRHVQLTICYL
jgi:hypothetical protein